MPKTAIIPVTDIYHGVEVVDNYRWLEDAASSDVKVWNKAQNNYARQNLDNIPVREDIKKRLQDLYYADASPEYHSFQYHQDQLFALKKQPPKDQPLLIVMNSPNNPESEKVILDPTQIDSTGESAIDFFVISPTAKYAAVSISEGGTEDGDLYIYEVATGNKLEDFVPRVNGPTAGGDIAWVADETGFYYTHYPRPGERPDEDKRFYQQVYYHKLGTPTEDDKYDIGADFPKIAEIQFETSGDYKYVVAVVADGDGGEFLLYFLTPNGKWFQIAEQKDKISACKFGPNNSLYLFSTKDASRGKIIRLRAGETKLSKAKTIIPESEVVIYDFLPTDNKIYTRDLVGGPYQMREFDKSGKFIKLLPILPISSAKDMVSLGGDKILYRNYSYLEPSACYLYDPLKKAPQKTSLFVKSTADFSDVEVVREITKSKDGTEIPMSVLRRKGTKLDGKNPTILYGYGGYGLSRTPSYDRTISLWLDNGGVFVIANIRGGGEFGEDWHKAGYLTNKQNVFDDFAACAQYLIKVGYTNSSKLAIKGGSNGGLLVGATMTQHPDLFKAVVCHKGVLDMLRVELDPNGEFNITEFGTVTNPDHFKALYAYSPYHNVIDGIDYPDILLTADENDGRVSSLNSKKMAARLQAATDMKGYILLRLSTGYGHGHGSSLSAEIEMETDTYAFLFDRLGVEFR
ncbi:MAG: S9 family peptidase [candidate division Zixibacteria bacterium]|nr:S9 family peptidase [candidate division Zixibacteria bacterium]